ncbi:MAG TPA: O-antigen ligase family protein [Clostridia bacterium]|nr:O-antigen ligase family protein [Clostridia bacterium]
MTNVSAVRALLVYALVLPAALFLGFMVATPTDTSSMIITGVVIMALSLPLLLKWHHPMLFLFWNMTAVAFFLPGSPELWLIVAFVSLGFALVERALSKEMRFIPALSITMPVIFLVAVVLITAQFTGGIGFRALGGQTVGGKAYLFIIGAAVGFWAMTAHKIPTDKALLYTGLFFLGSLANAMSTLIPYGPRELYPLAWLFPVTSLDLSPLRAEANVAVGFNEGITRFFGLTMACLGIFCFLLARYGLAPMLKLRGLPKLLLLSVVALLAAGGGFRSGVIFLAMVFFLVFYFEGLLRSKYTFALVLLMILTGALLVPLANKLPLSVQRTLSILPLEVDPVARLEAEASTKWRIDMWHTVLPLVPEHFWFGKGLAVSGVDLALTAELAKRGFVSSQETSMLAGNYHNGPLTVLIPFGVWGAIGWLWFLGASFRALYLNYKYGSEPLRRINTLLLAYFLARTIVFLFIFGDMRNDFAIFAGAVGLSIALNGGIQSRKKVAASEAPALEEDYVAPASTAPSFSKSLG